MKRLLTVIFLMISVYGFGQVPSNYLNIRSRYNLIAVKTDSGFHVPGYSTTPNYRGGVWSGAGNIGVDTVNNKFYFYSGGAWREAGSTNYADSLRRSGLAVQMRKNGNWTTQLDLPDSISTLDSTPVKIRVHNKKMFFISDTWDTTWSDGRGSTQDILIGDGAGGIARTDTIKGIIAIGDSALANYYPTSKWAWSGTMAIGHYAGQHNTTGVIQATGWQSLKYNTTGYRNVAYGPSSGRNNITGGYNWYGGQFAGEWATSKSNQTFTGNQSGRAGGGEFDSFYGSVSGYLSTGSITGVTITNGGSGYTSATVTFSSPLNVPPGYNLSETATGTAIIDGGVITGVTMTNIGRGYNAAHTHTVTITGDGSSATATPIMDYSGYNTSTGGYSFYNNAIGKYNVNDGYYSGYYGTRDTGTTNIGAYSGKLSSVSSVIKNATSIGYNAKTSQSNTIILGDTTVKTMVGVGTTQPTAMIDVRTTSDDAIRLDMPSKGAGKVLTSDANGIATWQTPSGGSGGVYVDSLYNNSGGDSLIWKKNGNRYAIKYPSGSGSSGWGLSGNSITAGVDKIGTTNNTSFRLITNNTQRGLIDSTGGWMIGSRTNMIYDNVLLNIVATRTYPIYIDDAFYGALHYLKNDGVAYHSGALTAASITTAAPTSGTAKPWKLGEVASVSPTSPNRTIRVEIDGTVYFIHAKTTND